MVSNTEMFTLYQPSKKQDLSIPAGTPLKSGSVMHTAIKEKRRVVIRDDKAMFGEAFIAVAIPIFNEKNVVIGSICVDRTPERQDQLKEMSGHLYDNVNVLASTTQKISTKTDSEDMYQRMEQLNGVITQIAEAITNVADAIQDISGMTLTLDKFADGLSKDEVG